MNLVPLSSADREPYSIMECVCKSDPVKMMLNCSAYGLGITCRGLCYTIVVGRPYDGRRT